MRIEPSVPNQGPYLGGMAAQKSSLCGGMVSGAVQHPLGCTAPPPPQRTDRAGRSTREAGDAADAALNADQEVQQEDGATDFSMLGGPRPASEGQTRLIEIPTAVAPAEFTNMLERERIRRTIKRILDQEGAPTPEIPLHIPSLRDLLAIPLPPEQYRITEWWPIGGAITIVAQAKTGKSTLLGNLLRSLVDGDPWLGRWLPTPFEGNVTVLDFEMTPRTFLDWLKKQKIRNDDRIKPLLLKGKAASFDVFNPTCVAQWVKTLQANNTSVLVLDCLRPILDACGVDEHTEVGKWFVAFDAVCDAAGVHEVAVIHHSGHDGTRARGDSRIRDWPTAEWFVTKESDSHASPRRIQARGRDVMVPEGIIQYDSVTRHYVYVDAEGVAGQAVQRVLYVLSRAETPLTQTALLDQRGSFSERSFKAAIGSAIRHKWVLPTSGKNRSVLHSITKDGRERLEELIKEAEATFQQALETPQ
jgi:hypothetical protein